MNGSDSSAEDEVEALIADYLDALHAGTAPACEDFLDAHPACRAALEELLPTVLKLEGIPPPEAVRLRGDGTLALPTVLDEEYRLETCLGQGGMGVVYEAVQQSLDRRCAVKVLTNTLTIDAHDRQRFRREAETIARLHHPAIVTVHSAGTWEGLSYYVMDLMTGPPIRSCCTTPRRVAAIGLQIADALAYAHSCGVLHCDVKPSNILVDGDGSVHLADFGLSLMLTEADRTIGGTPHYMSPERRRNKTASPADDQYALGVTLRELLAHARALQTHEDGEASRSCLRRWGRALRHNREDDASLTAILDMMTATDPARRYTSMHRAAEDLANFLEHRPILASPPGPMRRLCLWIRRRPAMAAVSALAVLCALGTVAALAVGYHHTAAARRRAEHSARVANRTLVQLLNYTAAALPSKSGTQLMNRLMPYYQELCHAQVLPFAELCNAYVALGTAARRSGQPELAVDVFDRLRQLEISPTTDNRYAEALYRCGRRAEARAADRQLLDIYADAESPAQRLVALTVCLRLMNDDASEQPRLTALLDSLQRDIPDDAEFRLQKGIALLFFPEAVSEACRPIPGGSAMDNALAVLLPLADASDGPRYATALLVVATRWLNECARGVRCDSRLPEAACAKADLLLGRWISDTEVSVDVTRFWLAYARYLKDIGETERRRALTDHLYGVLGVLFYNTEIPDTTRDFFLSLLLERLREADAAGDREAARRYRALLDERLRICHSDYAETVRREVEAVGRL